MINKSVCFFYSIFIRAHYGKSALGIICGDRDSIPMTESHLFQGGVMMPKAMPHPHRLVPLKLSGLVRNPLVRTGSGRPVS